MLDRIARQLRNLASPTPARPEAVDMAAAYDLVFQTVDPAGPNTGANLANVRRVRYCLDSGNPSNGNRLAAGADVDAQRDSGRPGDDILPRSRRGLGRPAGIVATNVVNRSTARSAPSGLQRRATPEISLIRSDRDRRPRARQPRASRRCRPACSCATRTGCRVAAFTATVDRQPARAAQRLAPSDPEGEPLSYAWYDGDDRDRDAGSPSTTSRPSTGDAALSLKVTDPAGSRPRRPRSRWWSRDPRALERGTALVVAMLVTAIMLALGFAALAFVDGQQRDSSAQTRVSRLGVQPRRGRP